MQVTDKMVEAAKDAVWNTDAPEYMRDYLQYDNIMRAALTAALAHREAVAVKPLEWRGTEGVWLKADAGFGGVYRITEYSGMQKPFKLETHGWWSGSPCGHYELLDEAKAAAQADYEQRIRSALVAPTAQEAVVDEALVERCIEIAREHLEIDGDGEGSFVRFDSIDTTVRAMLTAAQEGR